jgi:RNA polymerase sigma-70 factor (ECF subfamily)
VNGTFRAWLKTIARHQLIDRWRERQRLAEVEGAALDELVAQVAIDQLQDDEVAQQQQQQTVQLASCLEQLSEHAQTLIQHRYGEGLSLERLARRFKRSVSALGVALHRIRGSLRRCMEESS